MLAIYVAADQVLSLQKECSRLVEAGISYTKVGINFSHKAAQLVRDKLEDLDLDLYAELDNCKAYRWYSFESDLALE